MYSREDKVFSKLQRSIREKERGLRKRDRKTDTVYVDTCRGVATNQPGEKDLKATLADRSIVKHVKDEGGELSKVRSSA